MHTLGKVLAGLVVVAAAVGAVFASKAYKVRGGYLDKVLSQEAEIADNAVKLAELQARERELRSEFARMNLGWDRVWTDIGTQVQNPADGTIVAAIGSNVGLTMPADQNQPAPLLHAFQPNADGSHVYVGTFSAVDIRENQSVLVPAFVARPSDVATWQPGNWRYRSLIPAGYTERFLSLSKRMNVYDQLLEAKTENLEAQTQLKLVAEQHLQERLKELNGNPDNQDAEGDLPPEDVKGYVATITDIEEQRNQAWIVVDELRRRLYNAHEKMKALIQQNRDLAGELPGAEETISAGAPAQASNEN